MRHKDKAHLAVRDHIALSLRSVLNRSRFGFRTEAHEGWGVLIHKDESKYQMTVGVDFMGIAEVVVLRVDDQSNDFFYRNKFETSKMPNLRKIGITIANKIIHSPIFEVHSA